MAKRPPAKNRPKTPLSRDRVLSAAVQLADEDGVAKLSMRKLGQALGVEAMSLYKHVANKEAVLDGIVERVIAEIDPPKVGPPWRVEMRRRAQSAHAALCRHPWATLLIISRINAGPAMLRYVDATIGCLHAAGFSYALADHAWNAIDNHIYGYTLQKLNFPVAPEDFVRATEAYLPSIPREQFPHIHGLSAEVVAGRHDGLPGFDFGLELILDGLGKLLGGP